MTKKRGPKGPRTPAPVAVAELVENLALVGCTADEISTITGVALRTLKRNYGTLIKKGKDELRGSLRRRQVEAALAGNVTMLIWLGKQLLGQKDKVEAPAEEDGTRLTYHEMIAHAAKHAKGKVIPFEAGQRKSGTGGDS